MKKEVNPSISGHQRSNNMPIKKKIRAFLKKSKSLVYVHHLFRSRMIPEKMFIKQEFKKVFGYDLDLKNPKTFNEKLQWKKIYDRKPIYGICSDKYAVRDYIKKKVGEKYLIPLLYVTNNPESIPFSDLPLPYIIKSNHSSGQTIIVRDRASINEKKTIETCKSWLKVNYYYSSKEWQYKNIEPKIIVEKLLTDNKGKVPNDYKFHCFNGKADTIQVDVDRFTDHKRGCFDSHWNPLPFITSPMADRKPLYHPYTKIEKPKHFERIKLLAEKIAADFDYVRVDLYSLDDKIYFGELTFTHGSGLEPFFPIKYDKIFGNKLKL